MSRTIKVFYSQEGEIATYTSAARTIGEFITENSLSFSGKKVTVKETQVTLENNDAQLPDGNITLFVYPKSSKAGADLSSYTPVQISKMAGNNLRRTVRRLNAAGVTNINERNATEVQRKELLNLVEKKAPSAKKVSKPILKAVPKAEKKPKEKKGDKPVSASISIKGMSNKKVVKKLDLILDKLDEIHHILKNTDLDKEVMALSEEAAKLRNKTLS